MLGEALRVAQIEAARARVGEVEVGRAVARDHEVIAWRHGVGGAVRRVVVDDARGVEGQRLAALVDQGPVADVHGGGPFVDQFDPLAARVRGVVETVGVGDQLIDADGTCAHVASCIGCRSGRECQSTGAQEEQKHESGRERTLGHASEVCAWTISLPLNQMNPKESKRCEKV